MTDDAVGAGPGVWRAVRVQVERSRRLLMVTSSDGGPPGTAVRWWRRGLVALAAVSSSLAAIAWWSASDRSAGFTIILFIAVATTLLPVFIPKRANFAYACYVAGAILIAGALLLFFLVLVWCFFAGLVLLLTGYADGDLRPRMSRTIGGLGLPLMVAAVTYLLVTDISLLMQGRI